MITRPMVEIGAECDRCYDCRCLADECNGVQDTLHRVVRNTLILRGLLMSEETPLVRQRLLLRNLCAKRHGVSVREVAEEMGVTQKTIRRDLETFQLVGFKLREETGPHGKKLWRVDRENNWPEVSFTPDEAISLYLGRHLLEPFDGTLFWDGAQRAFRKIGASLGKGCSYSYSDLLVDRFQKE